MPRIYKGTTAKLALMYYPCVINPSDVSELTIAIYSEGTNEAIEYSLANMTLKDNIAFINLAKYQLDVLDNGVIKYVARGVYKGNEFVQDRYSNYYIQTPKDYVIEDVAVQDIKRVDISELITNVLPDSGYDGMGEVIVDANPLINNVADNAVTLDVDKNGTYVAELADNYKGYIKEINVSVPSVNVEQLTQEEYDNITPAKDKLYLISDAIPEHNLKTINGETLVGEGDIKIDVDLTGYATEQWVDDKGYLTEDELQEILKEHNNVPYLFIKNDGDIISGDFDAVYDAVKNDKPYLIYVYTFSNSGLYYSPAECVSLVNENDIQCSYDLTYVALNDETRLLYRVLTISKNGAAISMDHERVIPTQFKTINGNEITGTGDIVIESGTDIPYLVIDNLSILGGDFDAVYDAINNKQPYYIYKKRNSGELIDAECAAIRDNYIDVIFCVETYYDNELHFYFTSSEIYSDRVNCIKDEIIDIPTQFKTINGNDILGEGDIKVEANVDLTGYATEQWVDDKGYLKEIPSEYITETELNDALANVGGGNGNIVELTQEEYDNITPDEETLYLISDVAPKENLKTINGESIIGTGDIKIDVDLTGYATTAYVDEQLGNVNNILENIIG